MNQITKHAPVVLLLGLAVIWGLAFSPAIRADSVDQPPNSMRSWELTANVVAAYTRFTMTTSGGTQPIISKSILIVNDDPSGGNDVYFDISGGTAAAPIAGGTSVRIKPGEAIRADGRYSGISITSSAATVNIRVDVTF